MLPNAVHVLNENSNEQLDSSTSSLRRMTRAKTNRATDALSSVKSKENKAPTVQIKVSQKAKVEATDALPSVESKGNKTQKVKTKVYNFVGFFFSKLCIR